MLFNENKSGDKTGMKGTSITIYLLYFYRTHTHALMHTLTSGLSLTQLSKKSMDSEKSIRRSNNYFIYIFKEAEGRHTVGERSQQLCNGSIHFLPQGLTQSFSGIKKMEGYCIEFSPDLFSRYTLNKEMLYDLPFFGYDTESAAHVIPAKDFAVLYALFAFMHTEMQQAHQGYEKIIVSGINIVLLKCGQWFGGDTQKKSESHYTSAYYGSLQLVENYRRLIRTHCTKQHFVKFYAAQLNQTPNYLNVVVRSITGSKASDLIHAQIITEAKHLLIHTKLSHKEVAAELGFKDQSYFTKFFKRETGQNPLEWFRSNR